MYLGVRITRWPRGRRFQARSIYQSSRQSHKAALLPNGNVAWTGDEIFRYAYTANDRWCCLAESLYKLGAISVDTYQREKRRIEDYTHAHDMSDAADDLARNAKILGMPLETFQIKLLQKYGVKNAGRAA